MFKVKARNHSIFMILELSARSSTLLGCVESRLRDLTSQALGHVGKGSES